MEFEISDNQITQEQLEALYIYLSLNYNTMKDDEKMLWYELMKKIDKEFNDQEL
jgi:hypothetical protein